MTASKKGKPSRPAVVDEPDEDQRFPLIGPDQLSEPVPPLDWLIRGLWPTNSYGPWGGAKKTLKTYSATIAAVAVASGMPAYGNPDWQVPNARPVIYYGGEGSRAMHQRRLQRIAGEVYGLDIGDLPFYLVTDVGPLDKSTFREALQRNVSEVGAGLVVLDSLYNYHPANIEVSNLYERGRLLAGLSSLSNRLEVSLWLVDHFNKTGSGIDLDRLAQAGMAQWADSWMLFEHAVDPDVASGRFSIATGVGSRQWGGEEHTIHIDIGAFDKAESRYLSPIKVEVEVGYARRGSGTRGTRNDVLGAITEYVRDNPSAATRTTIVKAIADETGAGDKQVREAFRELVDQRLLVSRKASVAETGRTVTRDVWGLGDGKFSFEPRAR